MAKNQKRIEKELYSLKNELASLSSKQIKAPSSDEGVNALLKYIIDEREKTNKMLYAITSKIKKIEDDLNQNYATTEQEPVYADGMLSREIPLSTLDVRILNFAQSKGMICAEDLKSEMQYKGRNAACSRLNKLHKQGLLERFQLGHKVYYKYDAGKATNTLIISPPR